VNELDQKTAQPPKLVGLSELLVQAVQAFKSGGRQTLALAAFGIFLPQMISTWILAVPSERTASGLWKIALATKSSTGITPGTLPAMMDEVSRFFGPFLVYLSLHHFRPWAFPRLTAKELTGDMARLVLRRGILLGGLILSMGFATQAFALTSLFLAALSLMAPVLMIAEHKSALRSLTQSITLRYSRQTPMGGWSAFLSLVTLGGLFFSLQFGLEWLAGSILNWLGTHMPPGISAPVPGLPFTYGYAAVDALQALASTVLIVVLPGATAALYMQVHFRNSKRDLSIRA
jgi:hypothetical protein